MPRVNGYRTLRKYGRTFFRARKMLRTLLSTTSISRHRVRFHNTLYRFPNTIVRLSSMLRIFPIPPIFGKLGDHFLNAANATSLPHKIQKLSQSTLPDIQAICIRPIGDLV